MVSLPSIRLYSVTLPCDSLFIGYSIIWIFQKTVVPLKNNTQNFNKALLFFNPQKCQKAHKRKRNYFPDYTGYVSDLHMGVCRCPLRNFPLFPVIFMELVERDRQIPGEGEVPNLGASTEFHRHIHQTTGIRSALHQARYERYFPRQRSGRRHVRSLPVVQA